MNEDDIPFDDPPCDATPPRDGPAHMTDREIAAWRRCQGYKLPGGFRLELGMYGNGRGALTAIASDGIPEVTITVNIVEAPLEEGEFHVRKEARRHAGLVFDGMMQAGLASPTGKVIGAGHVEQYAEVWKLAL
jgi:hypothetical protein